MRRILYLVILVLSLLSIFGFTKKTELKFDTNPDIDISGNQDNIWRNTGEYDGIYVILMREDKEVFGKYIDKDSEENPLQGRPLEEEWFIKAKNDVEPYGVDKIIKYNGKEVKPGTAFYDKPSMIGRTIILTVEDKPKGIYVVQDGNKVGTMFPVYAMLYGTDYRWTDGCGCYLYAKNSFVEYKPISYNDFFAKAIGQTVNANTVKSYFSKKNAGHKTVTSYGKTITTVNYNKKNYNILSGIEFVNSDLSFSESKRTLNGVTGYYIGDGGKGSSVVIYCVEVPDDILENRAKYKVQFEGYLYHSMYLDNHHNSYMSSIIFANSNPIKTYAHNLYIISNGQRSVGGAYYRSYYPKGINVINFNNDYSSANGTMKVLNSAYSSYKTKPKTDLSNLVNIEIPLNKLYIGEDYSSDSSKKYKVLYISIHKDMRCFSNGACDVHLTSSSNKIRRMCSGALIKNLKFTPIE